MHSFMKGVGMGLIVGAAVGLAISPKKAKRAIRHHAGRAMRNVSHVVDGFMG